MTSLKRSPREQRMAGYVDEYPDSPTAEETPEERNTRINRNWLEIKKARIGALKDRNQNGVGILDAELASGRGTDFPADASFDEDDDLGPLAAADADDDLGPSTAKQAARASSQADVRKSEPSMALIEQEADERGWEADRRKYIAKHGVLTPGKTQSQAITDATGRRDPATTRSDAEAQHAVDTGELIYGDSAIYNIAKPAAAIAGFAQSGPFGAVAAEALVRATAIGYNLDAALNKGMDPDQAAELFVNEMSKGVAVDALFNFGAPVVGAAIMKIPGLNRIADKIHAALQRRLGGPAPRPELRDAKIASRQELTTDPHRKQAVSELARRVEGDYVPTPGQVKGKSGFTERRTYEAFPGEFQAQEEALGKAAGKMRDEFLQPASQPSPKELGERIVGVADATVKKTKSRLRPVFQEANSLKIVADFNSVGNIAREALKKDAGVVGKGKLTDAERNHLQKIVDDVGYQPWAEAEPALDFISVQKSMLRKLNPDGKPTEYFSTIVGDLTRAANEAYEEGARRMGKHAIVDKLKAARDDYRIMNETAYDGAIKQALRKGDNAPEDIGKYLWQSGKVTRIEQLDDMLGLAAKEGAVTAAERATIRRDVTRGFLQHAVQDTHAAANWTKSLSNPDRAATWAALTKGPDGQALKETMSVLEHAAQIATVPPAKQQSKFLGVPASRAVGGGLGISWVTFGFNPALFGAGLSIAGTMRLMATAYVHGDKGTLNLIAKVVRANSTATAASAKALQAALPQLESAAQKYDVTDLFMKETSVTQSEQSEQSEPK